MFTWSKAECLFCS